MRSTRKQGSSIRERNTKCMGVMGQGVVVDGTAELAGSLSPARSRSSSKVPDVSRFMLDRPLYWPSCGCPTCIDDLSVLCRRVGGVCVLIMVYNEERWERTKVRVEFEFDHIRAIQHSRTACATPAPSRFTTLARTVQLLVIFNHMKRRKTNIIRKDLRPF